MAPTSKVQPKYRGPTEKKPAVIKNENDIGIEVILKPYLWMLSGLTWISQ